MRVSIVVGALLAVVFGGEAKADVMFCNASGIKIATAVAYHIEGDNIYPIVQGWFILEPKECKVVLNSNAHEGYFAHAESTDNRYIWGGDRSVAAMCDSFAQFNTEKSKKEWGECFDKQRRTTGFAQLFCVSDQAFSWKPDDKQCEIDKACLADAIINQRGRVRCYKIPGHRNAEFGYVNPNDNDPSVRELLEQGGYFTKNSKTGETVDYKQVSNVHFRYVFTK